MLRLFMAALVSMLASSSGLAQSSTDNGLARLDPALDDHLG